MRAKAKSSSTPYPIWVEGEYITEPPIRIHHHIIINSGGLDRDDLELMWSTTRINWKKANDPEYRANVDYYGFVNCDRLQPNENGLEGIVNYINKRKKGCKKWSTSMNLKKPKVKKNDHKWSFRKLREYAKTPEDKEVWRKLYKGYEPTKIDFEYKPLLPANVVVLLSTEANYSMYYGAVGVTDEAGKTIEVVEGSRIPEQWVERRPPRRFLQLNSAPLCVPHEVDSWYVATVC